MDLPLLCSNDVAIAHKLCNDIQTSCDGCPYISYKGYLPDDCMEHLNHDIQFWLHWASNTQRDLHRILKVEKDIKIR